VGQLPLYYNYKNTGRPTDERNLVNTSRYIDLSNDPLFPFGFGLTYTQFEYSELVLKDSTLTQGEELEIKATISNTGDRFGEEVVQLYIQDVTATVARPVRELKGFQKIGLEPGASEEVRFTLKVEDLIYFGADRQWGIEPGTIRVWIGPNASKGLESSFEIK
jgi:beta-glucosidase